MQKMIYRFGLMVLIGLLPIGAMADIICSSDPNNLVSNCGFESGNFSGWTTTPAASGSVLYVISGYSSSGDYSAGFGAEIEPYVDTITQTLSTVPGHNYVFSFYLADNNGEDGIFQAYFDGNQELSLTGDVAGGFHEYSYDVTASTNNTVIQFDGNNPPASFYLDDVRVDSASSAPEPASMILFGSGLLGLSGVARRRKG